MTLIEFLRARIDEDEAIAREKTPEQPLGSEPWALYRCFARGFGSGGWLDVDPLRVIAECDGKRRIVDLAERSLDPAGDEPSADGQPMPSAVAQDVLRALAVPYAAHADYLEEWRLSD